MTQKDYLLYLRETMDILEESIFWLSRSFRICSGIGIKKEYSEEEFDAFETLTSRFARTSDIMLQKAFRSIDKAELEDGGTLIDALNRAHKRGLIPSVEEVRLIRELRNDTDVLENTPKLTSMVSAIKAYCARYLSPNSSSARDSHSG
jgi:hypothetical protein